MLVKEIMTKRVITIDQEKTIFDASVLYKKHKIGCLVVKENENCVGIVTERDIIERTICEKKSPEVTKVKEIMSTNIFTIHSLSKIEDAVELMINNSLKKLPVVKNGDIVGIVTATDISRARPELSKRFMETWVKPEWED